MTLLQGQRCMHIAEQVVAEQPNAYQLGVFKSLQLILQSTSALSEAGGLHADSFPHKEGSNGFHHVLPTHDQDLPAANPQALPPLQPQPFGEQVLEDQGHQGRCDQGAEQGVTQAGHQLPQVALSEQHHRVDKFTLQQSESDQECTPPVASALAKEH